MWTKACAATGGRATQGALESRQNHAHRSRTTFHRPRRRWLLLRARARSGLARPCVLTSESALARQGLCGKCVVECQLVHDYARAFVKGVVIASSPLMVSASASRGSHPLGEVSRIGRSCNWLPTSDTPFALSQCRCVLNLGVQCDGASAQTTPEIGAHRLRWVCWRGWTASLNKASGERRVRDDVHTTGCSTTPPLRRHGAVVGRSPIG